MTEAAAWRDKLIVAGEEQDDPIPGMVEDYYNRHSGAPRHDDPPHRRAAPP